MSGGEKDDVRGRNPPAVTAPSDLVAADDPAEIAVVLAQVLRKRRGRPVAWPDADLGEAVEAYKDNWNAIFAKKKKR